jgi:hypothetical protein
MDAYAPDTQKAAITSADITCLAHPSVFTVANKAASLHSFSKLAKPDYKDPKTSRSIKNFLSCCCGCSTCHILVLLLLLSLGAT